MVNQAGMRPPKIDMRNPPSKFEKEYKGKLTPFQFKVAYGDSMEGMFPIPPNEYNKNMSSPEAEGLYKSVASGEPLFSSAHKFTSRDEPHC